MNTRDMYGRDEELWCIIIQYLVVLKGDVSLLHSSQPNIQSCYLTVTSHEHAHVIQSALQSGGNLQKIPYRGYGYVRLLLTKPSLSVDSPYSRFLPRMFLSTIPSQSFPWWDERSFRPPLLFTFFSPITGTAEDTTNVTSVYKNLYLTYFWELYIALAEVWLVSLTSWLVFCTGERPD